MISTSSNSWGMVSIMNLLYIVIYGSFLLLNKLPFIIFSNILANIFKLSFVISEITSVVTTPLNSGFIIIGKIILPIKKFNSNMYNL